MHADRCAACFDVIAAAAKATDEHGGETFAPARPDAPTLPPPPEHLDEEGPPIPFSVVRGQCDVCHRERHVALTPPRDAMPLAICGPCATAALELLVAVADAGGSS